MSSKKFNRELEFLPILVIHKHCKTGGRGEEAMGIGQDEVGGVVALGIN